MRKMIVAVVVLALGAAAPAVGAPRDRKPPRVTVTTADGAVVAAAPADTQASTVRGRARDDVSGIRRVKVTYCPGSKAADGSWTCRSQGAAAPTTTNATLACGATRRSCTWAAAVPTVPGSYLVFARATDRRGRSRGAPPIQIYVV